MKNVGETKGTGYGVYDYAPGDLVPGFPTANL